MLQTSTVLSSGMPLIHIHYLVTVGQQTVRELQAVSHHHCTFHHVSRIAGAGEEMIPRDEQTKHNLYSTQSTSLEVAQVRYNVYNVNLAPKQPNYAPAS